MSKKYVMTDETIIIGCVTLHRIKALINFGNVKNGDFGGYIQSEENLSHEGDAWVYDNAWASSNAWVSSNRDYSHISGFGTACRTSTFFRCEDGQIRVNCGCFYGTIPEFREQVRKTREGKIAKEYLMIADLMELHFSKEGE